MIKTRFAPSPTGALHIGGVRTALFNWLYAKKNGGEFILRIEDTDKERSTQEAIDAILDGMNWLGLKSDGQYYQTKNFHRYQEIIQQLIKDKKAYYCNCSKQRLEQLRDYQQQNNLKIGYDGKCRDKSYVVENKANFVVRFKNPQDGVMQWDDVVKGRISIANQELDDMIIQKADGTPTYNFCVVVDDIDMNITHVIRGDDHINNTPKQIGIYQALGAKIPIFVHLSMILGADGAKLSKRHGATNVMTYREDGYLPEALLNYLVRLGWSHGDQEIFSLQQMIENFDLEHIASSASRFNFEKLKWLNKYYIKESKFENICQEVKYHFKKAKVDINNGPSLQELISIMAEKVQTLVELVDKSRYFYSDEDIKYDHKAVKKHFNSTTKEILRLALENIKSLDKKQWQDPQILYNSITSTAKKCQCSIGKVALPLRIAITGSDQSPSIGVTLKLIGKSRVVYRLDKAIVKLCD